MAHEPEVPSTQPSAPVEPARTTEDARPGERPEEQGGSRTATPVEENRPGTHGDPTAEHGDRMPLGADEPGAGL